MIKHVLAYIFLFTATLCPAISISATHVDGVKEIFVDAKDAKLFCRTKGKGKPLVVLHGGPGLSQDYLLPQLYKLADDNFVIFYDQRGCGQSTGEINVNTINLATFISDIEAIRQAFHFDKISLLGHSWGGFLAMQYAMTHPEHVDKLILSNSMPASSEGFSLFLKEYTRRIAPYQEEMDKIRQTQAFKEGNPDLVERYNRMMFRTYCYIPEKADLLNLRMTPTAAVNGEKVGTIFHQTLLSKPFDLHAQLRNLNIPTLILHGDFDPVPPITAQHTHENIKNSKYILIKHCGHFPYVEQPDEFFTDIKEFLSLTEH
jgi:proline iminopeptidase